MFILFTLLISAFAAEYDKCTDPQIITGTTNIYMQDMSERQVISKKKGIFVQFNQGDQSEGYHLYTLSDHEVAVIEVINCTNSKIYHALPLEIAFSANTQRTFYIAVDENVNDDIVIVVERMLYSEDKTKPIEIREEFFPLQVFAHGELKTGEIYYKIIGRTNWKVDLYIDDDYSTTYDVRQGKEEIVAIKIEDAGIHKIKFDYAKDVAQFQEIEVDTFQPSVLNAVFRPNSLFEENDCYEDTRIIVGYKGKANGKLVITDKASGINHVKYLKTNNKCIQIETGKAYEVNGEYQIILTTNMFVTNDAYVIFTVAYSDGTEPTPTPNPSENPEPEPEPEKETSEEGFTDEAIIAMSVVAGVVGILLIISLVLLIFIIYKKCTKTGGEYQQLN